MISLSFFPEEKRAVQLASRMRSELAMSLSSLLQQTESQLESQDFHHLRQCLTPAIDVLSGAEHVSPALFAAYYQLVLAALGEVQGFNEFAEIIKEQAQTRPGLNIKSLHAEDLGSEQLEKLYRTALDTDEQMQFGFLAPNKEIAAAAKTRIKRGLALQEKLVPEMAGEFRALVCEILLAAPFSQPDALRFDGVSSYQLWGALALSVAEEKSDLEMVETLAHEASHSFLFGLTIDEPLVSNPDDELFDSPLRPDARPMDGIYHATFVSARMHYAMREASRSGKLNRDQAIECQSLMEQSSRAFYDGHSIVNAKAQLTRTGRDIMTGAYEYMQAVCPTKSRKAG